MLARLIDPSMPCTWQPCETSSALFEWNEIGLHAWSLCSAGKISLGNSSDSAMGEVIKCYDGSEAYSETGSSWCYKPSPKGTGFSDFSSGYGIYSGSNSAFCFGSLENLIRLFSWKLGSYETLSSIVWVTISYDRSSSGSLSLHLDGSTSVGKCGASSLIEESLRSAPPFVCD